MNLSKTFLTLTSFFLGSTALQAGVVVNTSLSMTSFTVTPSGGTVQWVLPISASAFASAADSLGGADSNFDLQDNTSVAVSALTALAAANGSADAVGFTGGSASSVNIPDFEASANSTGQGTIFGSFMITGVSGPVNVTFTALLSNSQTLITTNLGVNARSETIFSLNIPGLDDPQVLFFDNLIDIGPDSSSSTSSTPTLSNTATLTPNTNYFFVLQVDSESSGYTAPEPSSLILAALGLGLAVARRFRAN